ncbi:filamentous hemagglutinin N-terminal domain-containing protein [Rivularia sp. PCC 7116]|uniref:two-partner secretion domain-containing protein n=1 Tax=Rivularia sp. PCC 7116 TaxID=373994 RepID=UPI0002D65239|nr:filamentous hemagglutinin N-terminal domain-containing protein [Rivularia sp. PCC 7116]
MLFTPHQEAAFAQVSSDATLPNNSQINQQGSIYNITGGTEAGNNLFHSFEKFSIPNGSEAYFKNNINIQNIFGRVTGKSISEINGLIRANGTANLFLMNPNGIVFGENAQLNIGGSFTGTTAEAFKFSDGREFSAINLEDKPLLNVNVPLGLQYGKNQNATITNSGNLTVNNGKNITLIGNSFENKGNLAANNGQISIAAIANQGFANLGVSGELLNLVSQPIDTIDENTSNIGTVINRGSINTSNLQSGNGGKIIVLGEKIGLLENSLFNTSGNAGGGEVIIGNSNTTATYIDQNAFLKADALDIGNGGNIAVFATESTRAYGRFSARGGLNHGNGGFVSTTGINFLDVKDITVDTSSNNGLSGNWLLSTGNTFLGSGESFNPSSSDNFAIFQPANSSSVLDISTINKHLGTGNNITIAATKTGNQQGNIQADEINIKTQNNNPVLLTLQADNDIVLSRGNIQSGNHHLGIVLQADSDKNSKGDIILGQGSDPSFEIDTKGGKFRASAASILLDGAEITSKNTNLNNSREMAIATPGKAGLRNSGTIKQKADAGSSSDINIIANGSIVLRSSGIVKQSSNASNAGDINIKADSFLINRGGIDNKTTRNSNGNAGNINVNVNSFILKLGGMTNETKGNGNSGLINIKVDKFDLDTGVIQNITTGNGNANDIIVNANSVALKNGILLTSNQMTGDTGNIVINATKDISIIDGALLGQTNGIGDGGNINIKADSLSLQGAINNNTTSNGNAGNINLQLNDLFIKGGRISSETKGNGHSGFVKVEADALDFNGGDIQSVTTGDGNANDVTINTGTASFKNSGLSTTTKGNGDAGNIFINADDQIFLGKDSFLNSGSSASGNSGEITVNSGSLILNDARIGSNTDNENELHSIANAGNIDISADSILLQNDSTIASITFSQRNAGEIRLQADKITLRNSSNIVTKTAEYSTGDAGKIIVETGSILFENELQFINDNPNKINSLSSNTEGKGNAGTIKITADKIILRNKGGIGIDTESEGDAGKLILKTSLLQLENSRIEDNAGIDSSSTGSGKAGELNITVDKLVLDNSDIKAQTQSGQGGNINLNLTELLLLRSNSRISTEAGSLGGGSGGNITIDAPDGFIVAVPNENSDITANAFDGKGGNIKITAAGIFGIKFREELTPETSDINASSELGIDGNVEINTPDLTSDNELAELPSIPISSELAQGCYSPGYAQNQFFIVGRGGLPPKPEDIFTPSAVRVEWVNPQSNNKNSLPNRNIDVESTTKKPKRIVEATGWILNEKGEIIFTADAPVIATRDNSMQSNNCELVREIDK